MAALATATTPIELLVKVFSSPPDSNEISRFMALATPSDTRAVVIEQVHGIVSNHFSLEETHSLQTARGTVVCQACVCLENVQYARRRTVFNAVWWILSV